MIQSTTLLVRLRWPMVAMLLAAVATVSDALPLPNQGVSRIAVGSCLDPQEPLDILNTIDRAQPELMIMSGDNVYAEDESADPELASLATAYQTLAAAPAFKQLRQSTPILATWDDHDYGLNDAGGEFPHKTQAKTLFQAFWQIPPEDHSRTRPGIYRSIMLGDPPERVQVILLDTRSFRSPLKKPWLPLLNGRYIPQDADDQSMLGDAQWLWLERELSKPADVRILVSSVQVLAEGHNWEAWRMLPKERTKLLDMVADATGRVIILSGDRHLAGLYRLPQSDGGSLWELTSSSLNLPLSKIATNITRETGRHLVDDPFYDANFGWIELDWHQRILNLEIRDENNQPVRQAKLPL